MKELFTKKFWRNVKETFEDARSGKNEPSPQAPPLAPEPAALKQPDPPPLPRAE